MGTNGSKNGNKNSRTTTNNCSDLGRKMIIFEVPVCPEKIGDYTKYNRARKGNIVLVRK